MKTEFLTLLLNMYAHNVQIALLDSVRVLHGLGKKKLIFYASFSFFASEMLSDVSLSLIFLSFVCSLV